MRHILQGAGPIAGIVLLSLAPLSAQGPGEPLTIEGLAARMRTALSGTEEGGARAPVLFKGKGRFFGADGTFELLHQPPDRFLVEVRSVLASKKVLNGEQGWELDPTGVAWTTQLSDLEHRKLFFWIQSGRWVDADSPVELELLAPEDAHEDFYLVGARVRGGLLQARVEVSRASLVPRKVSIPDTSGDETLELESWTEGPGILWPHRITVRTPSGFETRYELESQSAPPAYLVDPFRRIGGKPQDVSFDAQVDPRLETKAASEGHLLVRAKLDGKDVGWFVVDTGSGMCVLDRAHAGVFTRIGEIQVSGVGGTERNAYVRPATLQVGPLTWKEPLFTEYDLRGLSRLLEVEVAGILGADFFARAVVEVDVAQRSVAVHDPKRYATEGMRWERLLIDNRHPFVEAQFEGDRRGLFLLDTGSGADVAFFGPAVERLDLLKDRATEPIDVGGVGGTSPARTGKLVSFDFARRRFLEPWAIFSSATSGALADPYATGIVGGQLLRHFRIVFDYGSEQISFGFREDK